MALRVSESVTTRTRGRVCFNTLAKTRATACFSSSWPVVVEGVMKAMPDASRSPARNETTCSCNAENTWVPEEQPASVNSDARSAVLNSAARWRDEDLMRISIQCNFVVWYWPVRFPLAPWAAFRQRHREALTSFSEQRSQRGLTKAILLASS